MVVGIIGAMEIEIENLLKHMTDIAVEKISGIDYNIGTVGKVKVVAAVCGIGKVNAAICAQTMCIKYSPDYLINIGVAGSLSKDLKVGDLVAASSVVQHDIDSVQLGVPLGLIPVVDAVGIKCAEKLIGILSEFDDVKHGIIATGDQFVWRKEHKDFIVENYQAVAAEMEGGSIGQVCYLNNVGFIVIRCISDNADDDSDAYFEKYLEETAQKSINLVLRLLARLDPP